MRRTKNKTKRQAIILLMAILKYSPVSSFGFHEDNDVDFESLNALPGMSKYFSENEGTLQPNNYKEVAQHAVEYANDRLKTGATKNPQWMKRFSDKLNLTPITCYDCTHGNVTIEVVDLAKPKFCDVEETLYGTPVNETVEILQIGTKSTVVGYTCSFTVTYIAVRCGYDSITYGFKFAGVEEQIDISLEECQRAHQEKYFIYNQYHFKVHEEGISYGTW